jgi:hypothetical protein
MIDQSFEGWNIADIVLNWLVVWNIFFKKSIYWEEYVPKKSIYWDDYAQKNHFLENMNPPN